MPELYDSFVLYCQKRIRRKYLLSLFDIILKRVFRKISICFMCSLSPLALDPPPSVENIVSYLFFLNMYCNLLIKVEFTHNIRTILLYTNLKIKRFEINLMQEWLFFLDERSHKLCLGSILLQNINLQTILTPLDVCILLFY